MVEDHGDFPPWGHSRMHIFNPHGLKPRPPSPGPSTQPPLPQQLHPSIPGLTAGPSSSTISENHIISIQPPLPFSSTVLPITPLPSTISEVAPAVASPYVNLSAISEVAILVPPLLHLPLPLPTPPPAVVATAALNPLDVLVLDPVLPAKPAVLAPVALV